MGVGIRGNRERFVVRTRLLEQVSRAGRSVVVLSGGSGFGKTVLAEQVAATLGDPVTLWVDCGGRTVTWDGSLRVRDGGLMRAIVLGPLGDKSGDGVVLNRRCLQEYRAVPVCLVLDDAVVDEESNVAGLCSVLAVVTNQSSRVLLTTRKVTTAAFHGIDALHLQARDLRVLPGEAAEMAVECGGQQIDMQEAQRLVDVSGGQIGLLAILCRHPLPEDVEWSSLPILPVDLKLELERLALVELPSHGLQVLHAMALLGEGTLADVEGVVGDLPCRDEIAAVLAAIPLIRATTDSLGGVRFKVHALAASVFASRDFEAALTSDCKTLRLRAVQHLSASARYARVQELLLGVEEPALLAAWLEEWGARALDAGETAIVRALFARLTPLGVVSSPRLLLLRAQLLRELGSYDDAFTQARAARDLAEHQGQTALVVESALVLARLGLDAGDGVGVTETLVRLLPQLEGVERCQALSHLAGAAAWLGNGEDALMWLGQAGEALVSCRIPPDARDKVLGQIGSCEFLARADWRKSSSTLSRVVQSSSAGVPVRILALSNLACCLCEAGRLARARDAAARALDLCRMGSNNEQAMLYYNLQAVLACVAYAEHRYDEAEALFEESIEGSLRHGAVVDAAANMVYSAACRRSAGNLDAARDAVETAEELIASLRAPALMSIAECELAACELASGESTVAIARAQRVLGAPSTHHSEIRASLVVAAAADGSTEGAAALAHCASAFSDGCANWILAMYVAVFPQLLGMVAATVGVDTVPSHLISMLSSGTRKSAIDAAVHALPVERLTRLAERLGEDASSSAGSVEDGDMTPRCSVRLFGGLRVETADGRVRDGDWRKRKARLLFTMLVVRKGKDVPREQLLEYLWPEMDGERARSNFYVVWNNMKKALSPSLEKGRQSPFVRASGGVCRVDDVLVSTDLDEFEQCLIDARKADVDGDRDATLVAYRRLSDIYQGDLLPGDIYDDWFAPLRERCRQEFSDGMLRAAMLLDEDGEPVAALQLLRQALSYDPWREDLYQLALRCQIASGQRSAAIDTYMTCMQRLSEDLGLDPSAETKRLYAQVLAMEDPGSAYSC